MAKHKVLPDDGRNLTSELAEMVASLAGGNAALVVIAAQGLLGKSRQERLRFLAGDLSVIGERKPVRR